MGNSVGIVRQNTAGRRLELEETTSNDQVVTIPNANITGLARLVEAKAKFQKTTGKKEAAKALKQIHGTTFIKELYHRLDPSICMPEAIDITGDIQVAVKYNKAEKVLLLKLIQARHLVSKDITGYSDPYVVITIVPDRTKEGVKRTQKKFRTLNPVFQEIFLYSLDEKDLLDTIFSLDVFDHDIIGADDFLGQAVIDISKMNLSNELTNTEWFMLQQQTNLSITGEVEVSLYHHLDTLHVTVHEAKDLFCDKLEGNKNWSTYLSIRIPFSAQQKETKVVDASSNPRFEETFEFDLSTRDFKNRTVSLHIYHVCDGEHEHHVGDVTINLKRYNPGQHTRNWYRVSDLSNAERERTRHSENAVNQEFREAMLAHTLYHCPSFMFKNDRTGKKAYTVTCRQATATSKLVLVNGIPLR